MMTETSQEKPNIKQSNHDKGSFIQFRYIQLGLLTFMMLIMFLLRGCLPVAIVSMTTNNTSSNPDVPTYIWENTNILLSSFYWSYAVFHFTAGNFTQMLGTKWLLLISMCINSVLSILIPIAAKFLGYSGVMSCRIIQGLFQAFMLPSMNAVLGRWVPPEETSLANSIVYSGNAVGVILSNIITGSLSASSWGWPAAFYVFGVVGLVWCAFWMILFADTPALHRNISIKERQYIELSLSQQNDHLIDNKSVPWKAIFRSLPYWAVLVASIGESWGSTFLNSELPNYFSNAVGLSIEDSSLFSSVPVAAALIAGLFYGPIATYTINKGYTSKVNSRRIFHGFGSFSLALGLVLLPYMENKTTIAILLIATNGAAAGIIVGHFTNQIDISPRYVGVLCGISNGTGQLLGMFAPFLVDFIVTDQTDKTLWRYIFILSGVICTLTAIFFIIFCSGERQWWDDVDQEKLKDKSTEIQSSDGKTNQGFENDCQIK